MLEVMLPMVIAVVISSGAALYVLWQLIKKQRLCQQLSQEYVLLQQQQEWMLQEKTVLLQEKEHFTQEIKQLNDKLITLEKAYEISQYQLKVSDEKWQEWESQREHALQESRAALFHMGKELSEHLLQEHKRVSEEAKTASETSVVQTTSQLQEQFQQLIAMMSSLQSQVKGTEKTVEVVRRALLSPQSAGSLAELTLENMLHASGLIAGQDFMLQFAVKIAGENGDIQRLRPDAVIFLPQGNVLIVDSKASKFFLEWAEAEDREEETELWRSKLKQSMRTHVKQLSSKEYQESVRQLLRGNHKEREVRDIRLMMFLPTDSSLEKLLRLDKELLSMAWKEEIFLVGPAGLMQMLAQAKFVISETQRIENHEKIMDQIRKIVMSSQILSEHIRKVGGHLYQATNMYNKLASSFDQNFIRRAKALEKLGIVLPSNKTWPDQLERYHMVPTTTMQIVETEKDEMLAEMEMLEKEETL